MSEQDREESLVKELPDEIDGFIRRLIVIDYFVIEYSKRPVFMRYNNPGSVSDADLEENLLFDAKADKIEDAVKEIKVKIQEYRKENPE